MFRIVYIQIMYCVMESNLRLPLEMRNFFNVPCLDSKRGQVYSEVLVLIYDRWLEPSRNIICNLVRVRRLDYFKIDWIHIIY